MSLKFSYFAIYLIHFKFVGIKDMHNIYYLGLSGERSLPFGLLVLYKIWTHGGCLPMSQGCIHVYDHYFHKDYLLHNRLANQIQIARGTSMDGGGKGKFKVTGSHDQNGYRAHTW